MKNSKKNCRRIFNKMECLKELRKKVDESAKDLAHTKLPKEYNSPEKSFSITQGKKRLKNFWRKEDSEI